MRRTLAVTAAGSMLALLPLQAVRADTRAAASFPDSSAAGAGAAAGAAGATPAPFPEQRFDVGRHRHRAAYLAMAGGAALVGASFVISGHADRTYNRYLAVTDPDAAARLYDSTRRWDQLSTGTLLSGEALLVAGLWLRFLHHEPAGLGLGFTPDRCAVSLSF